MTRSALPMSPRHPREIDGRASIRPPPLATALLKNARSTVSELSDGPTNTNFKPDGVFADHRQATRAAPSSRSRVQNVVHPVDNVRTRATVRPTVMRASGPDGG